jgi:hypothetical protein
MAAILASLAGALPAQQISVDARIEPTLVGVGQLVTLTVEATVEGGIDLGLDPVFELENLEIVAGPSQSQQVSFVNGRVSRSQALSWSLQATATGTARVKGLVVAVNEQQFGLPEQVVEVQKEPVDEISARTDRRRSADPFGDFFEPSWRRREAPAVEPKLFLRAEISPKNPSVGEQVLYSLLLFTQADVGSVSPEELPEFEGMWSVDIEQPRRPKSVLTEVQGERYGRVVLLQRALFPLRAGTLRLEPVKARLVARIPERSWMGVFGSYDREYRLTSNAVSLDVRPLPPAPDGFRGGVGELDLTVDLEPPEIEVGEAATLSLTLSGKGHVNSLPAPAIPDLEGVRTFPPQKSGGDRAVGTTVRGEKVWSYVLVPERAGVWEIPIDRYIFFNPSTQTFEETSPQTLVLVARSEPGLEAPAPAAESAGPTTPEPGPPAPDDPRERERFENWLPPLGVFLFLAVLAWAGKRSVDRWRTTAQLRRQLRDAAAIHKPRSAAQTIERAWREFLSERWNVPPSTGASAWAEAARQQGIDEATAAEIERLADDLHYLRYAPELSAYERVRKEILERSRQLTRALG